MDLRSPRNDSGESDALQATEATLLEPIRQVPQPYLAGRESPLLHYLRVLKKRRWVVLATTAIIFTLAVIATLKETPLYQATSKVAIFPETPNFLGFKNLDDSSPDYQYDVALETQAAVLRSDALAMEVIKAMRLDEDPRFTSAPRHRTGDSVEDASLQPDAEITTGLLGRFHGGLGIQLIPKTLRCSVQISYIDPDPKLATEIVNTLVRTFTEQNFKTKYEAATQTSDWLNTEIDDLRLKVQTSEEKLVRYQKDHSILGVDEKQNIVTAKLDELNRELAAAEMDRIQKESTYKLATKCRSFGVCEAVARRRDQHDGQAARQAGGTRYAEGATHHAIRRGVSESG